LLTIPEIPPTTFASFTILVLNSAIEYTPSLILFYVVNLFAFPRFCFIFLHRYGYSGVVAFFSGCFRVVAFFKPIYNIKFNDDLPHFFNYTCNQSASSLLSERILFSLELRHVHTFSLSID